MTIRPMTMDDYPAVFALWNASLTSARDIDDSPQAIGAFLSRNPGISVVAELDGQITGSILCGHDGRRGSLYHVTVSTAHRRCGVGQAMVRACLDALRAGGIHRCALVAFTKNEGGNAFWKAMGFAQREDLFYRDIVLEGEPA